MLRFVFERGTDPEMTVIALQRCANLILELAGGSVSADIIDYYPEKLEPYKIAFSFSNCRALIGKDIDRQVIVNIIRALGMTIEQEGHDGLLLHVPRYKTDVTREADVIEEVMRIYGYNNVEVSKTISYSAIVTPRNFEEELTQRSSSLLEGFGFYEMMNLSLTAEGNYESNENLIAVLNPLSSDLNVMRASLLFGGLASVAHNTNRQQSDLRLFEFGRIYTKTAEGTYNEEKQLLLLATGDLFPQNPYQLNRNADVLYLKGVCEQLAAKAGVNKLEYVEFSDANFDSGIEAQLNKKCLFRVGMVNKKTLKKADVSQAVAAATISWQVLVKAFSKQKNTYNELSKFPSVRRDLALLVNRGVKFAELKQLAYATEKKFLTDVNLFDIYEGEKLGDKKSYAVSFTLLNKEATLTDKQIEGVMDKLIAAYKEKLGAELR